MFSVKQKREIADKVQKALRATNHPELPSGEIKFRLYVDGTDVWSYAKIENNGDVPSPSVNPWNEDSDLGFLASDKSELVAKILESLGIEKKTCNRMLIDINAGELVKVYVTKYALSGELIDLDFSDLGRAEIVDLDKL